MRTDVAAVDVRWT